MALPMITATVKWTDRTETEEIQLQGHVEVGEGVAHAERQVGGTVVAVRPGWD